MFYNKLQIPKYNLSMKEASLFVSFVMLRSPKPWCLLLCSWYNWKIWAGVHRVSFIMFQPTVEKLLTIEQLFIKISCKSKLKFVVEFGHDLGIVRKPFMSRGFNGGELKKITQGVTKLRFWVVFVIKNCKEMVLEGEIKLGNQFTLGPMATLMHMKWRWAGILTLHYKGVTHCMDKHGVSFIRYITWRNEFKKLIFCFVQVENDPRLWWWN